MMDSADAFYTNISSGVLQTTLPKAHQIFLSALPWLYTARKNCDHNLHYDVTINDAHTSPGVNFSVRIITLPTHSKDADSISVSIDTNDLNYYLTEAKRPIFLAVVNLATESAHWLFIQDYIYQTIQVNEPQWWQKNSLMLDIPSAHEIHSTLEELRQTVLYGLEFLYIKHYHLCYQRFSEAIQNFYNSSEHFEHSLQQEISRHYNRAKQSKSCNCSTNSNHTCSSCQEPEDSNDLNNQWDQKIQTSLEQAQTLRLLDPKENRTAYYCINKALSTYGERASSGMRLTALGEMAFYDYILHFLNAYNHMGHNAMNHLTHTDENMRYFKALEELTQNIHEALELGEVIATSMLTIRLADTFLFATPYIMQTFGQAPAAPLMDFAQNILVTAHDMASLIESPDSILQ